jgi:phenylacetic acid degradation operon negative regulatory protein
MAEQAARQRHQQLILTIYGLYARDEGGSIPVSALVQLLGELGVEEPGVRSSVSRLKRRGVLESLRRNGVASYALSEPSLQVFSEGDERIYSRHRATTDDDWLLAVFSVPESQRDKRHALRRELTWMGFGTVSPGVWIAPAHLYDEVRQRLTADQLDGFITYFRGRHLPADDPAAAVASWWDLDALDRQYEEFVQHHAGLAARWAHGDEPADAATARAAFRDYIPMFTQWRRLPFLDPGLPVDHLPADWNGIVAEELFETLQRSLGPWARQHAVAAFRAGTGQSG